ncbi:MAG: DUF2167 domain-containing protein, partial [Saprospiraceae bacterium]
FKFKKLILAVLTIGVSTVLVLNAVATMNDLPEVTPHIERIINCVEFDKRYQYADFTPGVDQVAAWTLGSLVTGKMLAKVGFFGLLLKFWKIIVLGLAGLGGAIWKILRGGNENEG